MGLQNRDPFISSGTLTRGGLYFLCNVLHYVLHISFKYSKITGELCNTQKPEKPLCNTLTPLCNTQKPILPLKRVFCKGIMYYVIHYILHTTTTTTTVHISTRNGGMKY